MNNISYIVRASAILFTNIRIYTEPYTKPYEIYAICNSIYIYTVCEHNKFILNKNEIFKIYNNLQLNKS